MNTADNNVFNSTLDLFQRTREDLVEHLRIVDAVDNDEMDILYPDDMKVLKDIELSVETAVMYVRIATLAFPDNHFRVEVSFDSRGDMELSIFAL